MVEPMGTLGGCANCHSCRVKVSRLLIIMMRVTVAIADDITLVVFEPTIGRAANMCLVKLPVASLHVVVVKKRIANVYSEPPIVEVVV